jgi:superfamily II DNA/RNA helicase
VDLIIQIEPHKEVDTYIHRAARTARAGRTGVSLLNYILGLHHILHKEIGRFDVQD